jgi:hypothetical protein
MIMVEWRLPHVRLACGVVATALLISRANAGDFAGTAVDLNRKGIDTVTVEAIAPNGAIVASVTSDGAGNYRLAISVGGPVSIRFSKVGRVGTTLDRLSGDTVGGKMDVVLPLETEMGGAADVYCPECVQSWKKGLFGRRKGLK